MEKQIDISEILDQIIALLVEYGIGLIAAILILIAGLWLAGRIGQLVRRSLERTGRIDETLAIFLGAMAKYVIIAVTVVAVLAQFGVEISSLLVIFGSAGLAIGLALQGTLGNVAAGAMLMIFRPFRVGDYVEVAGHAGSVKAIGLFVTELATPDNIQIIIPNGAVWGASVVNYSFHPTRRVDLVMGISYGDDIDRAMQVVRDVISADSRIHNDPEPLVAVGNLGQSSVDLTIRAWSAANDYWAVKFDLTKAIKESFDHNGISIPFPTRTVIQVAEAAE